MPGSLIRLARRSRPSSTDALHPTAAALRSRSARWLLRAPGTHSRRTAAMRIALPDCVLHPRARLQVIARCCCTFASLRLSRSSSPLRRSHARRLPPRSSSSSKLTSTSSWCAARACDACALLARRPHLCAETTQQHVTERVPSLRALSAQDIIINSLYSKKEIFLRELISNGAQPFAPLRRAARAPELAHGQPAGTRLPRHTAIRWLGRATANALAERSHHSRGTWHVRQARMRSTRRASCRSPTRRCLARATRPSSR
jgi:hypothetical protein